MSNIDLKSHHDKPFIQKIKIVHEQDADPDFSYLEQEYNDISEPERSKYLEQDRIRLEEYNHGAWWYVGVMAKTEILVPEHLLGYGEHSTSYRIVPIQSAGIWGIESDCSDDDFKEIEDEQLDNLKQLLKVFGIEVPNDIKVVRED